MARRPQTALPFIMAVAVAAGLARMVLRKVKEDREARAAQRTDTGTPRQD